MNKIKSFKEFSLNEEINAVNLLGGILSGDLSIFKKPGKADDGDYDDDDDDEDDEDGDDTSVTSTYTPATPYKQIAGNDDFVLYMQHQQGVGGAAGVTRVQQIDWYTASGIAGTMPANFYTDYDGHGTHCCGIAAGKTYGRAKNARIYCMTVSGLNVAPTNGISTTDVFDCIKGWHNNKTVDPATGYKRPTVVNMSWSYINTFTSINGGVYRGTVWSGSSKQPSYGMIGSASNRFGVRVDSVDVDVAELLAAGVVLVGAAGNYYQTLDVPGGPDYDNYFNQTSTPKYYMRGGSPASADGVICVGNVSTGYDTPEHKLGSSESGPRVDIYAPGTNIVSTCSTTNAFGATTPYPFNASYLIMSISGTSMASPNVAGLAAQLLQVYPTATPAQIRAKVIAMSTPNMLYDTGSQTDYSNEEILHGGPNRFAYQAFNTTSGGNISGPVSVSNTSMRT